ncbi:hypothetical protein PO909_022450 [Leuciscus waleckii]
MTFIIIFRVPDLGGFPPSVPVRTNLIVACFSRSKALLSTNSADTLWSSLSVSRLKCSFGLSLYSLIVTISGTLSFSSTTSIKTLQCALFGGLPLSLA